MIVAAAVLAMALGYHGPNGLDPDQLYAIATLGGWVAGDGDDPRRIFTKWIEEGDAANRAERRAIARAFVGCALPPGTSITYAGEKWEGELGLAPSLSRQMLPEKLEAWRTAYLRWADAQKDSAAPRTDEPKAPRVQFWIRPDEGKWVSACLMAHANATGSHEYISLRGNPPNADAAERLRPPAAERWTMGNREGVFLADLFHGRVHDRRKEKRKLDKSVTFSLNLPDRYEPGPNASWWPPNARVGRSLDYQNRSFGKSGNLVATRLGRFQGANCTTAAPPHDPDHAENECETTRAVGRLPPLFVYGPTVVNLESFPKPDPGSLIRVTDVTPAGTPGLSADQIVWSKEDAWLGAFPRQEPVPRDFDGTPGRIVGLKPNQAIEVELRPAKDLTVEGNPDFTAIVRYASASDGVARVEVSSAPGRWTVIGNAWPPTKKPQWLQIWPVYLEQDTRSLRIRITAEPGSAPLQLDAAAFVPGRPWCLEPSATEPYMKPCLGTYVVRHARH
jgi:hypothetical protein